MANLALTKELKKHTTVAQAQAVARACQCRMDLLYEGIVSDNESTKIRWPLVWVKPKTGVSTESFIQTNKPKALVFGPSRANGGYTAMTIKRALTKFGGSREDFLHFGDAIPSQAVFLSESNKSKTKVY